MVVRTRPPEIWKVRGTVGRAVPRPLGAGLGSPPSTGDCELREGRRWVCPVPR